MKYIITAIRTDTIYYRTWPFRSERNLFWSCDRNRATFYNRFNVIFADKYINQTDDKGFFHKIETVL